MVWAAGVVMAAVYIANLPIYFAASARVGVALGISFGALLPYGALSRAQRRAAGLIKKSNERRVLKLKRSERKNFITFVIRRMKLEWLELNGHAHIIDAMYTSLLVGALYASGQAFNRIARGRVRVNVRPDYTGAPMNVEFTGILSMKLGYIMLAAYRFAAKRNQEEDK